MAHIVHNYVTSILLFEHQTAWTVFFAAVFALFLLLSCYLFVRALRKIKEIKKPLQGVPWSQTYCIFSLYQVWLIAFILLLEIFVKALQLTAVLVPDDVFVEYFYVGRIDLGFLCSLQESMIEDILAHDVEASHLYLLLLNAPLLVLNITDFFYLLQTFEWKAMNFLLDYQRHRTVDEIQADQEKSTNEPIRLTLRSLPKQDVSNLSPELDSDEARTGHITNKSQAQATYRQKELVLRTKMLIFFGLFGLTYYTILLIQWIHSGISVSHQERQAQAFFVIFQSLVIVLELYEFCRVYYNMKKCHKYEFERTKGSMKAQIAGALLSHLIWIFFYLSMFYHRTFTLGDICTHYNSPETALAVISNIIMFCSINLQGPILILAYTIIFAKSSQDILQGISKLDYLMVVSVFQVTKTGAAGSQKKKQGFEDSMASIQSFVKESSSQNSNSLNSLVLTSQEEETRQFNTEVAEKSKFKF